MLRPAACPRLCNLFTKTRSLCNCILTPPLVRPLRTGPILADNAVHGVPACASELLRSLLRGWDFHGYTVSDTDSIANMVNHHKWSENASQASCDALVYGGCDINSGPTYGTSLMHAVDSGLCSMDDVDAALARTFRQRFDLGLFDPELSRPWSTLGEDDVGSEASAALNLEVAEQSLVLLLNRGALLPLPSGHRIAVVGPAAGYALEMMGTHFKGFACPDNTLRCVVTPFEAIQATNGRAGGTTVYEPGCPLGAPPKSQVVIDAVSRAVKASRDADYIVVFLGVNNRIQRRGAKRRPSDDRTEHEGHDRREIDLSLVQRRLVSSLYDLKKPVVVVLFNGGSTSIDTILDQSMSKLAVVEAMHPGPLGGTAITNGLFGQHAFGGRLPYSIYPATFTRSATAMTDMDLVRAPGKTFRYWNGELLFAFATGLSLATVQMRIGGIEASGQRCRYFLRSDGGGNGSTVALAVTHTSGPTVSQVTTAFWRPSAALAASIPAKSNLFAFERRWISPGQTVKIDFALIGTDFETADRTTGDLVVYPGEYVVEFTDGAGQSVSVDVSIAGSKHTIERFPQVGQRGGPS